MIKEDVVKDLQEQISYSDRYEAEDYIFRHVKVPKELVKYIPKERLMLEDEWRGLGIQQSAGWEHYMLHKPEPHILLFRRKKENKML